MAINKNHEFEDLNGVKCAIVERNVSPERVEFLKKLLEFNGYTVVVVASPPPKAAPVAKPAPSQPAATSEPQSQAQSATAEATVFGGPKPMATDADRLQPIPQPQAQPEPPPAPSTFTVGVTDVTFNPINAIFGRVLHTPDRHVVTLAYWQQKEDVSHDEVPYFQKA